MVLPESIISLIPLIPKRQVYFNPGLYKAMKIRAMKEEISVSDLVNQAISEFLDKSLENQSKENDNQSL